LAEIPMSEDTGFQFTDPRAYDEVLMRRLFEPWTLLLWARRLASSGFMIKHSGAPAAAAQSR